jgi:hypothetical protein
LLLRVETLETADSIDRPATAESTHWRHVFPGQSGSASGELHCCALGTHRLDVASCDRLVSLSSRFLIVTSPRCHVTRSSGNVRSSLPCCGRSKHVNRCDGMVAMPLAVPCAHSVVEQERAPPVGIFYCFSTFSRLSKLSHHTSSVGTAAQQKQKVFFLYEGHVEYDGVCTSQTVVSYNLFSSTVSVQAPARETHPSS